MKKKRKVVAAKKRRRKAVPLELRPCVFVIEQKTNFGWRRAYVLIDRLFAIDRLREVRKTFPANYEFRLATYRRESIHGEGYA